MVARPAKGMALRLGLGDSLPALREALGREAGWAGMAVAVAVGLPLVAFLDLMHVARHFAPHALAAFNLNGEGTVPAFFSAGLLGAAGALALSLAARDAAVPRWAWLSLGGQPRFSRQPRMTPTVALCASSQRSSWGRRRWRCWARSPSWRASFGSWSGAREAAGASKRPSRRPGRLSSAS